MSEAETVGQLLRREEILSGTLEERVKASGAGMRVRSVAERTAIKEAMLGEAPPGDDIWLFGYGSLIWNPTFNYRERRTGRVHGYHRRFCFWSMTGRGTPDRPGMMLGLERGGCCEGVVLRVARENASHELQSVFLREMMGESYIPRWVRVKTDDGPVRAITFVANRNHVTYAGPVPLETVAEHIRHASGHLGRCRDYLVNTVRHLEALDLNDRSMRRLLALVEDMSSE